MKSLEERKARALELRKKGYNCAQAVALVFDDVTEMPEDLMARLMSGLGSGTGGTGELCGAANAMAITQGIIRSGAPEGKAASAKCAGSLLRKFADSNDGRLRCADLKGHEGIRPCNDLILQCIEILHNHFVDSIGQNPESV